MNVLDEIPFPSRHRDAKRLLRMLLATYPKEAARRFVQEAGLSTADINWDGRMSEVWPDVLNQASGKRRLRALVELVARDPDSRAYADLFRQLLAAPRRVWYVAPDPYGVCFVGSGRVRPFIDRSDLRDCLRELTEPAGFRVLAITGARTSGKSYSWYMIANLAEELATFRHTLVDISDWASPPTPLEVMQDVAAQMDLDPMHRLSVDMNALPDTQARTLASWFVGKMADELQSRWIVFDGLDRPAVRQETLHLIEHIAVAAEQQRAGALRVILLGYEKELPIDIEPFARRERIGSIGLPQLRDFFRTIASHQKVPIDEGALNSAIGKVLEGVQGTQNLSLPELAARVTAVARKMFTSGT